jgi:pseudouridine synthase
MAVMRLQRVLARAGIASRRKAEELISSGKVLVNGGAAVLGQSVDTENDNIAVNGHPVKLPSEHRWLVLNKPPGYITSKTDARGRRTVFALVPGDIPGLTYVGRLDYLTEGLLLLTNDGEAIHALTHPGRGVERTYRAWVKGSGDAAAREIGRGLELDGRRVLPSSVSAAHVSRGRWLLELTLAEGRNREVRRLCEATGLSVERLVRTSFGPVQLGSLPIGMSRSLTSKERAAIERLVGN